MSQGEPLSRRQLALVDADYRADIELHDKPVNVLVLEVPGEHLHAAALREPLYEYREVCLVGRLK